MRPFLALSDVLLTVAKTVEPQPGGEVVGAFPFRARCQIYVTAWWSRLHRGCLGNPNRSQGETRVRVEWTDNGR